MVTLPTSHSVSILAVFFWQEREARKAEMEQEMGEVGQGDCGG